VCAVLEGRGSRQRMRVLEGWVEMACGSLGMARGCGHVPEGVLRGWREMVQVRSGTLRGQREMVQARWHGAVEGKWRWRGMDECNLLLNVER